MRLWSVGKGGDGPIGGRRAVKRALAVVALATLFALGIFESAAIGGQASQARSALTLTTIPVTICQACFNYTVNAATSGSGSGTVTSSPSGIDCPSTCSATFNSLATSSVTLTAVAASGSAFSGWSGACTNSSGTCTVNGSSGTATANFARDLISVPPVCISCKLTVPTLFTLTVSAGSGGSVTSSAGGINCPGTCAGSITSGASVTLTAAPSSGFTVGSWTGAGCSGTGTTCTLSVTADTAVSLSFAAVDVTPTVSTTSAAATGVTGVVIQAPTQTTSSFVPVVLSKLSVAVSGSGTVESTGILCGARGSKCVGEFQPGTKVKLEAGAASGFRFSGWSGGCSGRTLTCTLKISKVANVKAEFAPLHLSTVVPITINGAAFLVSWNKSIGSGKLDLHGTIGKPSKVSIELHRSGGTKSLLKEDLSLPAGKFSVSLKIEPGLLGDGLPLLPGGFVVTLGGKSGTFVVPTQTKTLLLSAPPQGVVVRAFASASQTGQPSASIRSSGHQAFVHFMFQTQPSARTPLSVAWYAPGGKLAGVVKESNQPDIVSWVKAHSALPKGTWRVDLRAGSTVVKSVSVQVT